MNGVTPLWAVAFAALFLALSARVVRMRARLGISLGDGGQAALGRAVRAHANCAEYGPLTLLLVFFLEQQTGWTWAAHGLLATFITGRLIHAWGVSQVKENLRVRTLGMVLTLSPLGLAAVGLLIAPGLD